MYRYAVFYNQNRDFPWRVVSQGRLLGIWSELCAYDYATEAEALDEWRRSVKRERNKREASGKRITAWEP